MNKRKLTYGILIACIFTCIFYGNANSEQHVVIASQYINMRNTIASLIDGQTIVKIMPNSENENELFIVNDKSYSVLVKFYDDKANIFYEHIAIPNHKTSIGNALELLESPLKVDYHQYLDNTFLSTLTATGLKEEDLPRAGYIQIVSGNKKAMAVSAIACFGAAIDFGVSTAELTSGKKVNGLKDFLKYIFLERLSIRLRFCFSFFSTILFYFFRKTFCITRQVRCSQHIPLRDHEQKNATL